MKKRHIETEPASLKLKYAFYELAKYRGAFELGWSDYVGRFKRSYLGPVWAALQLSLWTAALVLVFGQTLGNGLASYAIYVAVGLYAWDIISAALLEGPAHFTSQSNLLKNVPISIPYITVRKVSFIFTRSVFQLPVPLSLIIFLGEPITIQLLFIIPAIAFYIAFTYGGLIVLGVVGAYSRDLVFLMQSVVRFLFFTTPIFWIGNTGLRKTVSVYNPFSYFLEIFRGPLSGQAPSATAWLIVTLCTGASLLAAIFVQRIFRKKLIYWL